VIDTTPAFATTEDSLPEVHGGFAVPDAVFITPSGESSGVTDRSNIQTALDANFHVILQPGTFFTNQILEYPGDIGISAFGPPGTTKIRAVSAMSAVLATKGWNNNTNTTGQNPVRLANFEIDANGLATYGLVIQNFWSYFDDLQVFNSLSDGIRMDGFDVNGTTQLTSGGVENHFTGCQVRNCGGVGIRSIEPTNTIFTDGFIADCIIQDPNGNAIDIQRSAGWKIDGNHLYGLPTRGIVCGNGFMTRVANNYIETWGQSGSSGFYSAIDFSSTPMFSQRGATITGNTMTQNSPPRNAGTTIRAISCRAGTGATAAVTVTGNLFTTLQSTGAAAYEGLVFENQAASSTLFAVGNGNSAVGPWTLPLRLITNGGSINYYGESATIPWQKFSALGYQNNWTDGTDANAVYRRDNLPNKSVSFAGSLTVPVGAASGQTIVTLPAAYRPLNAQMIPVRDKNGNKIVFLSVGSSGVVAFQQTAGTVTAGDILDFNGRIYLDV
jgi:hypothetical protein